MTCNEYHRLISGYLDEAISPRQRSAVLEHLEGCPSCAATLARYRQVGVLLAQLPSSMPPAALRDRVLRHGPRERRGWYPTALPAVATLVAVAAVVVGLWLGPDIVWRGFSGSVPVPPQEVASALSSPADEGIGRMGKRVEDGGQMPVGDDAAVLQQVRVTVRRPGFRPMVPGYLPRGARLDAVNFGRVQPAGPIDRLEVAFATGGKHIRVSQFSADAADVERQQLEARQRWQPPKRLMVGGREWLYLQRDDAERVTDPIAVLIGQKDGMTIWVESSLPVEELARVAASLQD